MPVHGKTHGASLIPVILCFLLVLSGATFLFAAPPAPAGAQTPGPANSAQSSQPEGTSGAASSPGSPCLSPSQEDQSTTQVQASSTQVPLSGYVLPSVENGTATNVGSLSTSNTMQLEVVFAIRNLAQFQACAASISNPQSPNYGHFLNATSLQPYLPTPGQKASVVSFLNSEGFSTSDGASPIVVLASGTVAAAERMLSSNINRYRQGNLSFYGLGSSPAFPQNFAGLIAGITGLDNYSVARPLETPCGESGNPDCPQGLQVGYSFSSLYSSGYNGAGEKVAIVDAPGDPNIQSAINTFDSQYGLPSITLNIQYPDGTPSSYDAGWASETAMDVEAVHSVAPGAGIVLVYLQSTSDDPFNGIDYVATNHLATIVSDSWGYDEPDSALGSSFLSAADSRLSLDAAQGVTILFASGDAGAYPGGSLGVEFPASDPNVLAVGATNLNLAGCTGTTCTGYGSETGASISGGGYSGYFSEPSWQSATIGSKTGRAVPDVSMSGYDPGIWVYSTLSNECGTLTTPTAGWFDCAGTSLSTPLWAGFLAVSLQVRGVTSFGNIDPLIYEVGHGSSYSSTFHDITSGSNGHYSAGTGWDPVTGWGSPIASSLAAFLLGVSVSPTSPTLDSGQAVALTANPSEGTGPYTYKWYSGSVCSGTAIGTSSSYTTPSLTSDTTYCVTVTDSMGGTASADDTVDVNPPLASGAITPTSPTINDGASVTLTANPSGGTPPYSYQWYTGSSCASAISGAASSTVVVSPSSTGQYTYEVTDSSVGTPVATSCSAGDTVTVLSRIPSFELTALLNVYNSRPDLQSAFPPAASGVYGGLVNWAYGASTGLWTDSSYNALAPYAYWYALMSIYNNRPDLQAAFPNAYYSMSSYTSLINWAGGVVGQQWVDSSYSTLVNYGYWYALMNTYNNRPDLQTAFPGVYSNSITSNYLGLINWAGGVVTHQWADSGYTQLNTFGYWYDLMMTYNQRPDLQAAFPGAYTSQSEYQNLINWANGVVTQAWPDSSYSNLAYYASYYEAHAT